MSEPIPPKLDQTLFQRCLFSFDVSLKGDLSTHYVSQKYLEGLIEQKARARTKLAKAGSRLTILSLVVIAYIGGIYSTADFLGVKISQYFLIIEVASLMLSTGALAYLIFSFDFMFINEMIGKIIKTALYIENPHFFYAHLDADGIWADFFTIRELGYSSTKFHKIFSICSASVMIFLWLSCIFIAVLAICLANWFVFTDSEIHYWPFIIVMLAGDGVCFFSLIVFYVAFFKRLNWPFAQQADEIKVETDLIERTL